MLAGLFATALAVGGVAGPLISGAVVQHLGFHAAFYGFAALAAFGAVLFLRFVPETRPVNKETPVSAGSFV
jgi:MFS family permease